MKDRFRVKIILRKKIRSVNQTFKYFKKNTRVGNIYIEDTLMELKVYSINR
jgi:hypothetical protein